MMKRFVELKLLLKVYPYINSKQSYIKVDIWIVYKILGLKS